MFHSHAANPSSLPRIFYLQQTATRNGRPQEPAPAEKKQRMTPRLRKTWRTRRIFSGEFFFFTSSFSRTQSDRENRFTELASAPVAQMSPMSRMLIFQKDRWPTRKPRNLPAKRAPRNPRVCFFFFRLLSQADSPLAKVWTCWLPPKRCCITQKKLVSFYSPLKTRPKG